MQSAGVGPFFIDRAAAGSGIQASTVTAGASSQREDVVLEIEVIDQPSLAQALGNGFGLIVFGLKRIYPFQPHQVGQLDFDRHGAAIGRAAVTQTRTVTRPGLGAIHIHNGQWRSHGAQAFLDTKVRMS
jgi:hypothetical protein